MTETEQDYLSDASPKDKAAYFAADAAGRKKILAQDSADDASTKRFGKAAVSDWTTALEAYAKRNNISVAKATLEFANTIEAREIYKRTLRTPRADNISKSAAVGNISAETLSKNAFPGMPAVAAMDAWLKTQEGCEFYSEDVAARTRAQQGF